MNSSGKLPSFKILFKDSWFRFSQSFLRLFLLSILQIIGYLVLTLVFILIFSLILNFSHIPLIDLIYKNSLDFSSLANLKGTIFSISTALLLFYILLIILVSFLTNISYILILNKSGDKTSISSVIKSALKLVGNLFIANLLVGIIIFFGAFAFILPAIIFSFLFIFVPFEVIFEGKRDIHALKSSFHLVYSNFFRILIRIILFWIIVLTLGILTSRIVSELTHNFWITQLSYILLNILLGWFGLSYSLTLYKQVKKHIEKFH